MPWRLAAALIIILAGLNLSQTQASGTTDRSGAVRQNDFENDNNLIDNLFQNFNGNESSDGGTKKNVSIGPLPKPVSAPAEVTSTQDAFGRARVGREATIALANDRVVVRVPSGLSDDLEVSIKIIPTPAGAPPPGPVIGGLVFEVGAQPFGAAPLDRLPIEANLSARYTDGELGSRDESKLVLSWLDPADNSWKPAPKPAADARSNFLSATIQDLGIYAVHQAP